MFMVFFFSSLVKSHVLLIITFSIWYGNKKYKLIKVRVIWSFIHRLFVYYYRSDTIQDPADMEVKKIGKVSALRSLDALREGGHQ